jgi:sodium-dependent dicarboxylate transporter 2/3/5
MNARTKSFIKWGINIIVPLIIWCIPLTDTYTPTIRNFLVLSVFAIILIATENMPMAAASLMLPVAYVVLLHIPANVAYAPWALDVPWLILSGFLLTAALDRSGLLKRLAYGSILLMGGSFKGILFGLLIFDAVISLIISDLAAKAVLIGALALSMCNAMNFKPGDRRATFIGVSTLLAVTGPSFFFLTGSTENIVPMGIAAKAGVQTPSWLGYMKDMFVPELIYVILCAVVVLFLFRKESREMGTIDFFRSEYEKLGKMTSAEKKLVVVALALVVAIATSSLHGISVGWLFVMAVFIMFLPGINLATMDDFKKVNFPFLLFVTACLSIGVTANSLGVGSVIAGVIAPLMNGSLLRTSVGAWVLGFCANFALTPLAAYSAFTEPIVQIAVSGGLNPLPVLYAFINSLTQVLLPYESAPVMIVFGFGMMSTADFAKFGFIKALIGLICIICIFIPWWSFIGLV